MSSPHSESHTSVPLVTLQIMMTGSMSVQEQLAAISLAFEKLTKTLEEKDFQIATLVNKLELQTNEDSNRGEVNEASKKDAINGSHDGSTSDGFRNKEDRSNSIASLSVQQLEDMITSIIRAQYRGPSQNNLMYSKPYMKRINNMRMPAGHRKGPHRKKIIRSLKGNAFDWYTDIEPKSIDCWEVPGILDFLLENDIIELPESKHPEEARRVNEARYSEEAIGEDNENMMTSLQGLPQQFTLQKMLDLPPTSTRYAEKGQPWAHENGVVPSTLHQCLKFYRDREKMIDGDCRPFTEVESHFADEKFYMDSETSQECLPIETSSSKKNEPQKGKQVMVPSQPETKEVLKGSISREKKPPSKEARKESHVFKYVHVSRRAEGQSPFIELTELKEAKVVKVLKKVMPYLFKLGEKCSNNVAKYQDLINGLQMAIELGISSLAVSGDSKLVINLFLKKYEVKKEDLVQYFHYATNLIDKFDSVKLEHVLREENHMPMPWPT
ncbi:hypothetical protein RJ640_007591 [Escallonia rubra]|uniref:RNase H type-1 domain-containing protein n=1 Tax=Escallonia rubra TaxID=112253 RepID=A0AA88RB41_9ASTE|nr:hypothetical protein RJ640_007591 [Escallonia rubra]